MFLFNTYKKREKRRWPVALFNRVKATFVSGALDQPLIAKWKNIIIFVVICKKQKQTFTVMMIPITNYYRLYSHAVPRLCCVAALCLVTAACCLHLLKEWWVFDGLINISGWISVTFTQVTEVLKWKFEAHVLTFFCNISLLIPLILEAKIIHFTPLHISGSFSY